jgi:hypothetical protein
MRGRLDGHALRGSKVRLGLLRSLACSLVDAHSIFCWQWMQVSFFSARTESADFDQQH